MKNPELLPRTDNDRVIYNILLRCPYQQVEGMTNCPRIRSAYIVKDVARRPRLRPQTATAMLFSAILIILALAIEPCRAGLTPVIDLGYARYRGTLDPAGSNNTQFLGIRFAAPPTGA